MGLTNYGASKAVNLCSRYVEKSTKYSEQKCASYLENKISCLTFPCASSFRDSDIQNSTLIANYCHLFHRDSH
jgi:hypothetical protein